MAQSSPSVFVIVEGNRNPRFGCTLKDGAGAVVPRPGVEAVLVAKLAGGGSAVTIPLDWSDTPSNTHPVHEWEDDTVLPVGVYRGEVTTDPGGDDEWTFPTEASDLLTLIVRARLG